MNEKTVEKLLSTETRNKQQHNTAIPLFLPRRHEHLAIDFRHPLAEKTVHSIRQWSLSVHRELVRKYMGSAHEERPNRVPDPSEERFPRQGPRKGLRKFSSHPSESAPRPAERLLRREHVCREVRFGSARLRVRVRVCMYVGEEGRESTGGQRVKTTDARKHACTPPHRSK